MSTSKRKRGVRSTQKAVADRHMEIRLAAEQGQGDLVNWICDRFGFGLRTARRDLKAIQKDPLFKEWEARIPSIHAAFGNTGPKVSLQWSCADHVTRQAIVFNVRLKTAAELQVADRGEEAGPAGAGAPAPGSFAAALEDYAGRM